MVEVWVLHSRRQVYLRPFVSGGAWPGSMGFSIPAGETGFTLLELTVYSDWKTARYFAEHKADDLGCSMRADMA